MLIFLPVECDGPKAALRKRDWIIWREPENKGMASIRHLNGEVTV
jgi:hypothetical protein